MRKREDFESNLKVSTEATVEYLVSAAAQVIGKARAPFPVQEETKGKDYICNI